MEFGDIFKDKLHNMDTEGRSEKYSDDNIFPYEPTPYSVLERLADSGIIDENSYVIDYGSGLGRAPQRMQGFVPGARVLPGKLLNGRPNAAALKSWAESL